VAFGFANNVFAVPSRNGHRIHYRRAAPRAAEEGERRKRPALALKAGFFTRLRAVVLGEPTFRRPGTIASVSRFDTYALAGWPGKPVYERN
jgi:hypothetical protein